MCASIAYTDYTLHSSASRKPRDASNPYTSLPNDILYHDALSALAKIVFQYYISRPSNWKFHLAEICKTMKLTEWSVKSAIKELSNLGFIKKVRAVRFGKVAAWITLISEYGDLNSISQEEIQTRATLKLGKEEQPENPRPALRDPEVVTRQCGHTTSFTNTNVTKKKLKTKPFYNQLNKLIKKAADPLKQTLLGWNMYHPVINKLFAEHSRDRIDYQVRCIAEEMKDGKKINNPGGLLLSNLSKPATTPAVLHSKPYSDDPRRFYDEYAAIETMINNQVFDPIDIRRALQIKIPDIEQLPDIDQHVEFVINTLTTYANARCFDKLSIALHYAIAHVKNKIGLVEVDNNAIQTTKTIAQTCNEITTRCSNVNNY